MKIRLLGLCVLFLSLLLTVAVVSAASANRYTSDVYTLGLEPVDGAVAHLSTSERGVRMSLNTKGLTTGDVVTVWWVIFNNPSACSNGIPDISNCGEPDLFNSDVQAEVHYATGTIVGAKGSGKLAAQLFQGTVPRGWFGNGLLEPTDAEIHLVVRSHGQVLQGRVNDQILTFAGGCSNVPPEHPGYSDGAPGPNPCEDLQFAVFQQ